MIKLEIRVRLVLMNCELSYIHTYKLKVPAFSCQVDDLILLIWPYQYLVLDFYYLLYHVFLQAVV